MVWATLAHTVVALQQAGFQVYIIDDLSNTQLEVWDKITGITGVQPVYYNIDLKDFNAVSVFFQSQKIDGVVHFAAYKAVGESVEKPLMYYRNNLVGLAMQRLLDAKNTANLEFFNLGSGTGSTVLNVGLGCYYANG